jgi:hypothetical protein
VTAPADPESISGWAPRTRIWGITAEAGSAGLERGRDLVLHPRPGEGGTLPKGVLLDDWLSREARAELELAANQALAEWRGRCDAQLTLHGVCLPWVHEGELFADVFLREQRVVAGLRAAFAEHSPERVELHGMDPDLATALRRLLAELEVGETRVASEAEPWRYPITFARAAPSRLGLPGALRQVLGVPARVRGSVLVKPYWHLAGLWAPLLEVPGAAPVVDPVSAPALPRRQLAAVARRGGWIGHPGARRRRRSRAALAEALAALGDGSPAAAPLDWLVERRARVFLEQRARDTLASVETLRAAFAGGRIRRAVAPSDGSPDGRAIVTAGRESGVELVQVQHGFFGDLWRVNGKPAPFVDGLVADRVAVWSERDARRLAPHAPGEVRPTGNPGAVEIARGGWPAARVSSPRRALVLVQPPPSGTAAYDARDPYRHVEAALRGLGAAGAAEEIVLRPHPLDPGEYGRLAAEEEGLRVMIDRTSPIEALLAEARVCVATLSTATLQAAAAAIPTVFLDTSGVALPWPFDGSGAFPRAAGPEELAGMIPSLLHARPVAGASAASEALGAREDAVERVLELILR